MSDEIIDRLRLLAKEITPLLKRIIITMYENPEEALKERKTSLFLSRILDEHGFRIKRPLPGLPTAFKASLSVRKERPSVAYLAEMDALPGLGHACGHNVVAAASVAAGILLAKVLREKNKSGTVIVFGTPAEEKGYGKAKMAETGLFDDVDAAMMVHPSSRRIVDKGYLAMRKMTFTFHGKAAHASAYPEHGVNALDAMILFFSSVGLLRQQLPEGLRLHGVITNGGTAPNIIPDRTDAYFYLRAKNADDLEELTRKIVACARGAAKATGCRVTARRVSYTLQAMKINQTLAETYREGMRKLGLEEDDAPKDKNLGSSDIGNVSLVVPAIQPLVPISSGKKVEIHTNEFREATVTEKGFEGALEGAILLAYTGFRFLTDRKLRQQVRREFSTQSSA